MEPLTDLWLPILVSAILTFIASSIIHMVLPLHRSDYRKLPAEDELLGALRSQGLKRGVYMFPCPPSMKEMGSPEMLAKYEQGPVGHLTILPSGPPAIGKALGQWFAYMLIVSLFVGYIASQSLVAGADYLDVFQITGATAVLAYAISSAPDSIWRGIPWSTTAKYLFDGIVYGLVTAGTFGWLWPA